MRKLCNFIGMAAFVVCFAMIGSFIALNWAVGCESWDDGSCIEVFDD